MSEIEERLVNLVKQYVQSDAHLIITPEALDEYLEGISAMRLVDIIQQIKGGRWGNTLLHWAALSGNTKLIDTVFKRVSVEQKMELIVEGNHGMTNVIQEAAGNSRPDTLRYLLDSIPYEWSIALLKHRCSVGDTAVHRAAFSASSVYDASVMEILLNHTPSAKELLFQQNLRGFTPLHYAVFYMEDSAIQVIMSKMDNEEDSKKLLMIKDFSSYSALHLAATNSSQNVIESILDPLCRDTQRQLLGLVSKGNLTPKDLAEQSNRVQNYQLLEFYESFAGDSRVQEGYAERQAVIASIEEERTDRHHELAGKQKDLKEELKSKDDMIKEMMERLQALELKQKSMESAEWDENQRLRAAVDSQQKVIDYLENKVRSDADIMSVQDDDLSSITGVSSINLEVEVLPNEQSGT